MITPLFTRSWFCPLQICSRTSIWEIIALEGRRILNGLQYVTHSFIHCICFTCHTRVTNRTLTCVTVATCVVAVHPRDTRGTVETRRRRSQTGIGRLIIRARLQITVGYIHANAWRAIAEWQWIRARSEASTPTTRTITRKPRRPTTVHISHGYACL